MIPVFYPREIRAFDAMAIEELNIPSLVLMENAAMNAFEAIAENVEGGFGRCAILCGRGNNGGDGYALARQCAIREIPVSVFSLFPETALSPDAAANFQILRKLRTAGAEIELVQTTAAECFALLNGYDVIIDAILGSGARGPLPPELKALIEGVNTLSALRIALDIPTGVDALTGACETAFRAEITISFAGLKTGVAIHQGAAHCGTIISVPIGVPDILLSADQKRFPPAAYIPEIEDILELLPKRLVNLNKYSAGKVLTVGGSALYQGAGLLTATAPFYVGAGASILAVPRSILSSVQSRAEAQLIIESYEDEGEGHLGNAGLHAIYERLHWCDVLVLGPGISKIPAAIEAARKIIEAAIGEDKIIVLDADGLDAFPFSAQYQKLILTPHTGEFTRLVGKPASEIASNPLAYIREFSIEHKVHTVYKDFRSCFVASAGDVYINPTGNNGLAKFGSGDVLAGVIAGLAAQTKSVNESVITGLFLHGLAADILAEEHTEFGYTAPQLFRALPKAIKMIIGTSNADDAI